MKRCTLALAIALPIAAFAQSRPDPADPKAAVPPLRHAPALEGYRPFKDAGPAPWRVVNEEVKGMGGHAGHAAPKKKEEERRDAPRPAGEKPR